MKKILLKIIYSILNLIYLIDFKFSKKVKSVFYTNLLETRKNIIRDSVFFNGKFKISNFKAITFGVNIHIGDNSYFKTEGGLLINDNTHISRNVTIYTVNHNYFNSRVPYDEKFIANRVYIGKNVWIGMNVSILPGVKIGDGAIIGMGSVVTKDVSEDEIWAGNPAKKISQREYSANTNEVNYGVSGSSGLELNSKYFKNYKSIYELKDDIQPIFVLSTGRSGSKSIVDNLKNIEGFHCEHESNFNLIRLSAEYSMKLKSVEEVKNELIEYYSTIKIKKSVQYYLESDQKLSNLIEPLIKIFPNAKFVWLIRDPKSFIRSATSRNWFAYNKFNDRNALINPFERSLGLRLGGNVIADFSESDWEKLSITQRNAWYWQYWNKNIENDLNEFAKPNYAKVKLDNLHEDFIKISKLLNINININKIIQTNKMKAKDKKRTYNINEKAVNEAIDSFCDLNLY